KWITFHPSLTTITSSGEISLSLVSNTQSTLAFLLFSATVATFLFRRETGLPSQLSWTCLPFLAFDTVFAPWNSSVLI
ncbi:hypothetical protein, partial [Escherichia coli]|uniref:hypothetical protein n=1 Tax=Escherichia coli TaxID=562 RepID=UPI00207C257E